MPLGQVGVKHLPYLFIELFIEFFKPLGYVLMYGGF